MNAPITITATLPAWITSTKSVDRVLGYIESGQPQEAVANFFYCRGDMDKGSDPWVRVGEADITVHIQSRDELVTNQLQTLKNELDAGRAEWLTRQQGILDRINKLQAITNEVAS